MASMQQQQHYIHPTTMAEGGYVPNFELSGNLPFIFDPITHSDFALMQAQHQQAQHQQQQLQLQQFSPPHQPHHHHQSIPRQSSMSSNSSYCSQLSPAQTCSPTTSVSLEQQQQHDPNTMALPQHVRDKVFNPPSAANPQHYTRSARRNRNELNEKRNHKCDYPGESFTLAPLQGFSSRKFEAFRVEN